MHALILMLFLAMPLAAYGQSGDAQFHLAMEFAIDGQERLPFEVVMGENDFADVAVAIPDVPYGGQRVMVRTTGWDDQRKVLNIRITYLEQSAGKWQVVEEPGLSVALDEAAEIRLGFNDVVKFSVVVKATLGTGGLADKLQRCEDGLELHAGVLGNDCCRVRCVDGSGQVMTCCASGGCCACGICCIPN
jgi:hypothetical protein